MIRKSLLLGLMMTFWAIPHFAQDDLPAECEGFTPAPMTIGWRGRVLPGPPNNVRRDPTFNAESVGVIPGGESFIVTDGPVCAEGFVWWKVSLEFAPWFGWTAEAIDGEYWIEPITLTDTPITPDNAAQLAELRRLQCQNGSVPVGAVALSEDDALVAFSCTPSTGVEWEIDIYDMATDQIVSVLPSRYGGSEMAFSPDNTQLTIAISTSGRDTLHLWDIETQTQLASTSPHSMPRTMTAMPNGSGIFLSEDRYEVTLRDAQALEVVHVFRDDNFEIVRSVAVSPDGSLMAAMDGRGYIVVWDIQTGSPVQTFDQGGYSQAVTVTFSPDGQYLLSANCVAGDPWDPDCGEAEIIWWDVVTGESSRRWITPPITFAVGELVFNPDASVLVVGAWDQLMIFAVETGDLLFGPAPAEPAHSLFKHVTFSSDGTFLLTGDTRTSIWGIPD